MPVCKKGYEDRCRPPHKNTAISRIDLVVILILRLMHKLLLFALLFFTAASAAAQDSIPPAKKKEVKTAFVVQNDSLRRIDSAENARLQHISDSLAFRFVGKPDSLRPNQFVDSLIRAKVYRDFSFLDHAEHMRTYQQRGKPVVQRESWVLLAILALYLYFGLLNLFFGKDIGGFIRSFYSKRAFNQFSREENLFKSTAFISVFIFFGCVTGMFLYILGRYFQIGYLLQGPQLLLALSVTIIVLFALKLIVLRLIGFIFDIQKLVSGYISVVYLSYFNLAFAFLPLLTCISLMAPHFGRILFWLSGIILGLIIVIQFIRGSIDVLSAAKFRKTYLIIYLCALEICPILLLIKALRL